MTRLLITAVALALSLATAHAGGDWNDKGIAWQAFEAGLAKAKQEKKPVMLIVFTEWCPHCTSYSKLFHDQKVVEKSRQFVMVRVDKDKQPDVSRKHAPDGVLDPALDAKRDKYRYFYNESDPTEVLAGMDAALAKLNAKPK